MKEKLDKLIFNNTCIFFIYIFALELIIRFNIKLTIFDWAMLRITLSSVSIALFCAMLTSRKNSLWQKITISITSLIILIYAWIQIILYNYLGFFYSISNAGLGMKVTDYFKEMISATSWTSHLLIIPFIFITAYYWWFKKILKQRHIEKTQIFNFHIEKLKDIIMTYIIVILILWTTGLLFYGSLKIDFMQSDFQQIKNIELIQRPDNSNLAVSQFGIFTYALADTISKTFNINLEQDYTSAANLLINNQLNDSKREIDDTSWQNLINNEENKTLNNINKFLINRNITSTNEMTGLFENKNLIVILMESVNEMFINEEYFPTFYKLWNEGISFRNNYSPRNSCATGNNEITAMTSLYITNNTCVARTNRKNVYPQSIFNMFNSSGYNTSSYHNFIEYYYFRRGIHTNMGSSRYMNAIDLDIPWTAITEEWPSDIELVKKALPNFINTEPFMAFLTTVTSHQPYNVSSTLGDLHLNQFPEEYPIAVKRYLSKLKELDLALELLLKELEENGKLENTVIALFADHNPHGLKDSDLINSTLLSYDPNLNREIDRTPMVIYNAKAEPLQVYTYTAIIDLLPTILNLFNIRHDPRVYLGIDIFSSKNGFVSFADGSWQSAAGFYNGLTGRFTPSINTNKIYNREEIINISSYFNTLHNVSSEIIRENYFEYLYSKIN